MNLAAVRTNLKNSIKNRYGAFRTRRLDKWLPKPLDPDARPGGRPLVVSLTSYGDRLNTVHVAIKSLMKQTVRPSQVVLYLDDSVAEDDIPERLRELTTRGLTISYGHPNYKSHKKYRFAFEEFPEANVVLADDDLVYARDTLETLVKGAQQHPGAVIGRRAHRMTFDEDGRLLPYSHWGHKQRSLDEGDSASLVLTSGAGSLYPPEVHEKLLNDFPLAMDLAPHADDLWLKTQETLQGVPLISLEPKWFTLPPLIPSTQAQGLFATVNAYGGNDEAMKRLMAHYGLTGKDFGATTE